MDISSESGPLRHNVSRYDSKPTARHVVVDARRLSLGNDKLRPRSQRARGISQARLSLESPHTAAVLSASAGRFTGLRHRLPQTSPRLWNGCLFAWLSRPPTA